MRFQSGRVGSMKHISVRVAVVLSAVVLAVAGCSSSSSSKLTSSPTPKVKVKVAASPSPAGISDQQWAVAWQLWGMATPPPRNLDTLVKEPLPATAQNLTNMSEVPVANQLSDAVVAKWLAGFQRSKNLERYFFDHLADQALQNGPLADPSKSSFVYAGDLLTVAAAKKAGATAMASTIRATDKAVGIAFVPEALRTDPAKQSLQVAPLTEYVVVLHQTGPVQTDQVFADGHKVPVVQLPAGAQGTYLEAGTFKIDPVLGPVWYGQHEVDCKDYPALQSVCSLLGP